MMATGYVHPVADGEITTLKAFALRCSYAMMPLVTLRNDDHKKDPPRELPPLNLAYYEERLAAAQKKLDDIAMMTDAQRQAMIEESYQADLASAQEYDAKAALEIDRCKAMRAKVEVWADAPEGLKAFMLDQFDRSLTNDDYRSADYVKRRDVDAEWRRAVEEVGTAHAAIEREKALHKSRNAWLAQLWSAVDALGEEA